MPEKFELAIGHRESSFSEQWISMCDKHGVPYRKVDCANDAIMTQLDGCQALMWHWSHNSPTSLIMARYLTTAAECLRPLGLDVALLANNHVYDCLEEGFVNTTRFLDDSDDSGIKWLGAGTSEVDADKLKLNET